LTGASAAVLGGTGVEQPPSSSMQAAAPVANRFFMVFVIIAFIPFAPTGHPWWNSVRRESKIVISPSRPALL